MIRLKTALTTRAPIILLGFLALTECLFGQQTIAVCKGQPMPTGRVPVAEFESDGCSPPNSKNAWDTAVPSDGTVTCLDTRDVNAAGNVLQFMFCEKRHTPKCPLRLDGGPNGFTLRDPSSCDEVIFHENLEQQVGLTTMCINMTNKVARDEIIVGLFDTPRCVEAHGNILGKNAAYVRTKVDREHFAVISCVGPQGLPYLASMGMNEIIIRRFHSDFCDDKFPNYRELNALVILKIFQRPDKNVTVCYGTPMIDYAHYTPEYHQEWAVYAKNRQQDVYDPACGGPTGVLNGVRIVDGNGFRTDPPTPWD